VQKLQFSSLEVLVFEVHMTPLFRDLVNFVELIHVELPDKGRQVFVPEEVGQNLILQLFGILYEDFGTIISPGNEVFVLIFLKSTESYF